MDNNFVDEIKVIIDSDLDKEQKRLELSQYHESDIADAIQDLSKEERLSLYKILGDELTSLVFSYLDDVSEYVDEIDKEKAAELIELMDTNDAVAVLDELSNKSRDEIMSLMDSETIDDINLVREYKEDEIGSRITTNYISVKMNMTVKEAMKTVISQASENDNVTTIFVIDEYNNFYGSLELRDLIIARENDLLDNIIKTSYPFLFATENVMDAITRLKEYDLDLVPVLESDLELIGVITSSDILETVDEQNAIDYAKLAGLTGDEVRTESVLKSVKKRIPWLTILFFLGLFVALLISGFEDVVKTIPMIVFFQSMVLGMSGNGGTQSLAVTIRTLNDEKVNGKMIAKTLFKELRVGLTDGFILGVISFGSIFLFLFVLHKPIKSDTFMTNEALLASFIVSISLFIVMGLSSVLGSLIPIIFSKCHIDPAVASGPFISTLNDITAVLIYYGLAYILFIVLF